MHNRTLGPSSRQVSAIGMGVMPLSVTAARPPQDEAVGVILHAIDCGITFFDTADSYCLDDREAGHNERLLGKALAQVPRSARQGLTVATKGGLIRPQGRWEVNGDPEHLRQACHQSLQNLGVDRIDLYQYHSPDPKVPLADSLGQLKLLQDAGKIEHVGVSNFSVAQLDQAQRILAVISVQNRFSPRCRNPETDGMLQTTTKRGLALIPWSPLNGMGGARQLGKDDGSVVGRIAFDHGVSPQQVTLAWLLAKGPTVIPIPGASRKATIEDSARAAQLKLSDDEQRQLDLAWR